jgi:sensor histidine kinase regulating citrate/malate metabolism
LFIKFLLDNKTKTYYQELAGINEKMLEIQRQYYKKTMEKDLEARSFRHDINNHFSVIQFLLEKGNINEIKKYVAELNYSVSNFYPVVQTGNDILNAIVTDLTDRYSNVKFKIEWKGLFPQETKIAAVDLCAIFSNLLINAVESVEKFHSKEILTISVAVRILNQNIVTTIKNPSLETTIADNIPATSKSLKALHGFGTKNALKHVEKYGGKLEFNCDENEFTAEILFLDIF